MFRSVATAIVGAVGVVAAFPMAAHLAAEAWSPGAVGLWLLFALPGLALLALAVRGVRPVRLALLFPVALVLLGLDVTDSARPVVVAAGYALAAVAALAAAAAALALYRRRPAPA